MQMQTGAAWACLPCSFAMVVKVPIEQFIKLLGHDGSAKPYPEMPEQVAGFHEQECIEVLQHLGFACTPIEIVPQMVPLPGGPVRQIWFPAKNTPIQNTSNCIEFSKLKGGNRERFYRHIKMTTGVFTGIKHGHRRARPIGHAVAWDGEKVYDPQGDGLMYPFYNMNDYGFTPHTYWKVQKING